MDDFDSIDSRRDEREAEGMQGNSLYRDPPDYSSQNFQPSFDDIQPNAASPYTPDQSGMGTPDQSGSPDGQGFQNNAPAFQQSMGDELNDIDGLRDAQTNPDMQNNAPNQGDPSQGDPAGGGAGQGQKPQKNRKRPQPGAGRKRPPPRRLQRALQTGDFSGLDLRGDLSRYKSLQHLRNPDGTLTARDLVSPDAMRRHQMHMQGLDRPIPDPNSPHGQRLQQMREAQIRQIEQNIQRRGINLSNAHLGGTNLSNTDLSSARARVNLTGANLQQANLQGANLSGQSLERANLTQAQLQKANLAHARMDHADLNGANLRGAKTIGASTRNISNPPPALKSPDIAGPKRR